MYVSSTYVLGVLLCSLCALFGQMLCYAVLYVPGEVDNCFTVLQRDPQTDRESLWRNCVKSVQCQVTHPDYASLKRFRADLICSCAIVQVLLQMKIKVYITRNITEQAAHYKNFVS